MFKDNKIYIERKIKIYQEENIKIKKTQFIIFPYLVLPSMVSREI